MKNPCKDCVLYGVCISGFDMSAVPPNRKLDSVLEYVKLERNTKYLKTLMRKCLPLINYMQYTLEKELETLHIDDDYTWSISIRSEDLMKVKILKTPFNDLKVVVDCVVNKRI